MAEKDKKYYWLRLKRDFFKRHDIQIIESMKNGKDYILFYLKLLCESVDHEGNLRFSEQIPYDEKMLSTITNTNIDIVRSATKIFTQLHMMDILDDGTIYMNEVQKMIGSETYWAEKKRIQRGNEKILMLDNVQQMSNESPTCPSKSKSIEIDKEIEKDKEIESESMTRTPKESKSTFGEYKHVRLKDSELAKLVNEYGQAMTDACITFLDEYIEMKGYKAKSHYLCIRKWVIDAVKERQAKAKPNNKNADALEQSYKMMSQWAMEE